MCLALIAMNQHPLYPVIILSNRDEFYSRETAPAHFWDDAPEIYAGKDLQNGGTWLGVNQYGYFALITNYRNPAIYSPQRLSRGFLTKNYLLKTTNTAPADYLKKLTPVANQYNAFNLVVGTANDFAYFSNIENQPQKLGSGLYGLSNHLLDTPWYKVLRAKEQFKNIMPELITYTNPEQISTRLFSLLKDNTLAPRSLLPHTGVSLEEEKALSSIFVTLPAHHYGTRCSSIVLFTKDAIFFSEETFIHTQTIKTQTLIPVKASKLSHRRHT